MEWGAAECGAPGVFREAPSRPALSVSGLSQQAPRLRGRSWSSRVSLPGGKETRGGSVGPRARASWVLHSLCARLSARVLLDDQEIGVSSFRDGEIPSEGLSPWPSLACKPVLSLTLRYGIFQMYSNTYMSAESLGPQPRCPSPAARLILLSSLRLSPTPRGRGLSSESRPFVRAPHCPRAKVRVIPAPVWESSHTPGLQFRFPTGRCLGLPGLCGQASGLHA